MSKMTKIETNPLIYLPKITYIGIENWRLMKKDFSFQMGVKGVYAIIGGNTQGKTTLVNAILFCLIGKAALPSQDDDYFRKRLVKSSDHSPTVQIRFYLGDTQFIVYRDLLNLEITSVSVIDSDSKSFSHIPDKYQDLIVKYSNLASFEQFKILVLNLCYFPENEVYLQWNFAEQDRILRFLFQNPSFDDKLEIKRKEKQKLDSKRRNMQFQLSKIKRSVSDLKEAIDDIDIEVPVDVSGEELPDLLMKRTEIVEKEYILRKKRAILKKQIEEHSKSFRKKQRELDKLEKSIASEEERAFSLMFQKVTPLTKYIVDQSSEDLCIGCGEKRPNLGEKFTLMTKDGTCVICKEKISFVPKKSPDRDFNQLENMQTEYKKELESFYPLQREIRRLRKRLKDVENNILDLREEISDLTIKIEGIKIKEFKVVKKENVERLSSDYTAISRLKKQINKAENELKNIDIQRSELKDEINELLKLDRETKKTILKEFIEFYNRIGSDFLGRDVKLEWFSIPKSKSKDKRAHQVLIPLFSSQRRESVNDVSETERIILDIAFRMALIEFWTKKVNRETTLILETPDNSLDPSYVSRIAKIFLKFSNSGNTLLITSNLVNPQVLKAIFKEQDPEVYILDLLIYGKKTKVQEDEYEKLEKVVQEIYGRN